MLQVYVLNISDVSNICCKRMFVNVLFVSDVCCSKCFMLQVLHDQARKVSADGCGPLRCSGPGRRGGPHMHAQVHGYLCTAAAGGAEPASMAAAVCGDNSSSARTVAK